jgi:hypothetical protein
LYVYNREICRLSGVADERVEVAFPGSQMGFDARVAPAFSRTLERIVIHAALNPYIRGGKIINMADNGCPSTFRELWFAISGWFGLVGVEAWGPYRELQAPL